MPLVNGHNKEQSMGVDGRTVKYSPKSLPIALDTIKQETVRCETKERTAHVLSISIPQENTKDVQGNQDGKPLTPGPSAQPSTPGPSAKPLTPGPSAKPSTPGPSAEILEEKDEYRPSTPGPSAEEKDVDDAFSAAKCAHNFFGTESKPRKFAWDMVV